MCCSPWGPEELDMTERLNTTTNSFLNKRKGMHLLLDGRSSQADLEAVAVTPDLTAQLPAWGPSCPSLCSAREGPPRPQLA